MPQKAAASRERQHRRKDGVVVLNKARAAPRDRTVVVLGPTGSALMVARVLQALGVHMDGATGTPDQTPDLTRAMRWRDIGLLRQLIDPRNAAYPVWGWQCPTGVEYADVWTNHLRNPYVVAIFADPFVASTRQRIRMPSEVFPAMERLMHELQMQVVFLRQYNGPTLVCSRERAIAEPETFVRALDNFLRLDGGERWPEAISLIRRSSAPRTRRR
jgi:hypothetical protein